MQNAILDIGWDKFALGVLLMMALLIGFFKLDTLIGAPKKRRGSERPPSGKDRQGRSFYSDPDGRPWKRRRKG